MKKSSKKLEIKKSKIVQLSPSRCNSIKGGGFLKKTRILNSNDTIVY